MSAVRDYALDIVAGRRGPLVTTPGMCLSFARTVTDNALGISTYSYGDVPAALRNPGATAPIWVREGLGVAQAMPGDMLMQENEVPHPLGHVALYLGTLPGDSSGQRYVLENTTARRGRVISGGVRLTRLEDFLASSPVTSIIRFPEDTKSAADQAQAIRPGGVNVSAGRPPASTVTPTPGEVVGGGETGGGGLIEWLDGPGEPQGHQTRPDDPLWVYNTIGDFAQSRAPGDSLTNLGPVRSMVVLRRAYADELEQAMPFLGPFSITVENAVALFKERWRTLRARYEATESWGRVYEPLGRLSEPGSTYRWPLPFTTGIELRQTIDGNSVAEIELHVEDHEAAELILASLNMAQRYKNVLVEVWLPVTYYDKQRQGERLVLEPMFTGVIEEVTAAPWPHSIRFRVVPQDTAINQRGLGDDSGKSFTGHWEKTPVWRIIGDIGEKYRILFYGPTLSSLWGFRPLLEGGGQIGLSGYPTLEETPESFDAYRQPPLDVVRQLIEQRGLRLTRISGFEVFGRPLGGWGLGFIPRSIWMVYDPLAYHPGQEGFWTRPLWSQVFGPVARLVAPGDEVVGNVAVFYPHNLAHDPKYVKLLAATLDTFATDDARRDRLWNLVTTLQSLAQGVLGLGDGPAVKAAYEQQTQSALISWLDSIWKTANPNTERVTKALCPVLEIESFVTRTPAESEMTNPLYGTDVGKDAQVRPVTAARAAHLMEVRQGMNGLFSLMTANGPKDFAAKDQVYLNYVSNLSRPYTVIPAVGNIVESGRFYPHVLTLNCKPSYGVRPGMMAALVGFGRIDGIWEVQSVEYELESNSQTMRVTLRTLRDLYLV